MTELTEDFKDHDAQLLDEVREELKGYLRYVKGLGYSGVALSEESLQILDSWNRMGVPETLDVIRRDLGSCQRCKL
ncbi:MAG: hypothetical protein PVJ62_04290, partial [Deltaproteobacteria bacterium]